VLLDRGFVGCYDALTGDVVYEPQRFTRDGVFTVSPWACDGKLFFLNEFGETFVVKAGPEFELLHSNRLADDDMCMATPAIAGDRLLIRSDARIYCIAATE
jgi:hypothetical protein